MAYSKYIDLVNALRNRFNEPVLTTGTWSSVVGFDQFTKDAINYAYHDILNAEMEWPFLHQNASFLTIPGQNSYTASLSVPAGFTSPIEIKECDWDQFLITNNRTSTTIASEIHTIPATSPYTVAVSQAVNWGYDLGVTYSGGTAFTPVTGDPIAAGQYTITPTNGPLGTYVFNSADAGQSIKISYITYVSAQTAQIETPTALRRIDYDFWVQNFFETDSSNNPSTYATPMFVFKQQFIGGIGLSPVPDKVYRVVYQMWVDGSDLSATTDTPLIPTHFNQVILDGASKYCYEFREDPQMAQLADARFKAGITRMRIELINRDYTMNAGVNWTRGTGYASPFVF